MIRHFCDGCDKELRGHFATVVVAPKWFKDSLFTSSFRYELCDDCYARLRVVINGIPENTVKEDSQ